MGRPDPMRDPNREPMEPFEPTPPPGPEPGRRPGEPGEIPLERRSKGPGAPEGGEGAQVRGPFPSYSRETKTSGKAVASLVLAILGLFIFPIILSLVAIILGWAALRDIGRQPATKGRGLAIAGIVIGALGLIIGIVGVIVAATYNWVAVYIY